MAAVRAGTQATRGRPAHGQAAYAKTQRRVARAWKDAGRSSGEECVYRALDGEVPRRIVREHLRRMKARLRRRRRQCRERDRLSIVAQARDVLWSLDATHLGRDGEGEVQAEVLRDAVSASALSVSAGRPSSGDEVVALLERTSAERGGAPLVIAVDGGAAYHSEPVAQWANDNGVVILKSAPHVPQHNAWVERGHREIKEESQLGKGTVLEPLPCARWTLIGSHQEVVDGGAEDTQGPDLASEPGVDEQESTPRGLPGWCRRLARSVRLLNERRARSSRGGWTASQLDAALPRGDHLVCRESFLRTVRRNIELALLGAHNARARTRARRHAILCSLDSYGLVRHTRGGRPFSPAIPESQA